ncbi:putative lipopolysaccharide biosynthesis protein [Bdellovibrio bacteriovorus W]|nr:putative lipopolysaccharide biosynthesis protein [Bdellovibrio bacteriovorus W]
MRILVIQLARLGDIYMTWPVMRALKRTHPQAEIHLLTRSRFQAAVEGLQEVDHHHQLNVAGLLEPLLMEENLEASLGLLQKKIHTLRGYKFDKIINLSFSPVSSYLTNALTTEGAEVRGYSRHPDGTLHICDENSGYFYSQVGVASANRVHITDLFAAIADVDYTVEDWRGPQLEVGSAHVLPEKYAVLHVGASEGHKAPSVEELSEAIRAYAGIRPDGAVVLVGAENEETIAAGVQENVSKGNILNLVGKTKLVETFALLQDAEVLIGGDSAPLHMAALTDTCTLNLNKGQVNFYETGPKAGNAGVLLLEKAQNLRADLEASLRYLLEGVETKPDALVTRSYESIESFAAVEKQSFEWGLLKAIYLRQPFPVIDSMEVLKGAMELANINAFAIEQIQLIPEQGLQLIGPLLDSAEDVIQKISRLVPELSPMINWYNAEKVRIGPGSTEDICAATLHVHLRMAHLLEAYVPNETLMQREEVLDGTL